MKVIFLDNDGVICLSRNWGSRFKKWSRWRSANPLSSKIMNESPVNVRFDDFDKKAVRILNDILLASGAEIVVSSDWRGLATLAELGEYYLSQGIIKAPISMTTLTLPQDLEIEDPKTDLEETRSLEILEWLREHPQVTNWVAIDDLDMSKRPTWGLDNFVLCKKNTEGIKQSGLAKKILNFLQ
jgi:hypothetical protein